MLFTHAVRVLVRVRPPVAEQHPVRDALPVAHAALPHPVPLTQRRPVRAGAVPLGGLHRHLRQLPSHAGNSRALQEDRTGYHLHLNRRIVSYRIVSYRILSYPIVSYRIVSYRIVSYRIVSYRIVSSRLVSSRIVLYRIVSYRIISYRIVSYHIVAYLSYRIISYRIVSYRIVSYRIVSYCIVSYRIVSLIPALSCGSLHHMSGVQDLPQSGTDDLSGLTFSPSWPFLLFASLYFIAALVCIRQVVRLQSIATPWKKLVVAGDSSVSSSSPRKVLPVSTEAVAEGPAQRASSRPLLSPPDPNVAPPSPEPVHDHLGFVPPEQEVCVELATAAPLVEEDQAAPSEISASDFFIDNQSSQPWLPHLANPNMPSFWDSKDGHEVISNDVLGESTKAFVRHVRFLQMAMLSIGLLCFLRVIPMIHFYRLFVLRSTQFLVLNTVCQGLFFFMLHSLIHNWYQLLLAHDPGKRSCMLGFTSFLAFCFTLFMLLCIVADLLNSSTHLIHAKKLIVIAAPGMTVAALLASMSFLHVSYSIVRYVFDSDNKRAVKMKTIANVVVMGGLELVCFIVQNLVFFVLKLDIVLQGPQSSYFGFDLPTVVYTFYSFDRVALFAIVALYAPNIHKLQRDAGRRHRKFRESVKILTQPVKMRKLPSSNALSQGRERKREGSSKSLDLFLIGDQAIPRREGNEGNAERRAWSWRRQEKDEVKLLRHTGLDTHAVFRGLHPPHLALEEPDDDALAILDHATNDMSPLFREASPVSPIPKSSSPRFKRPLLDKQTTLNDQNGDGAVEVSAITKSSSPRFKRPLLDKQSTVKDQGMMELLKFRL
eukprot:g54783.t1